MAVTRGICRWLNRLVTAVVLLEAYGERVNPWNIRDVWPLTAERDERRGGGIRG